jgi:hypothetical protein
VHSDELPDENGAQPQRHHDDAHDEDARAKAPSTADHLAPHNR